MNPFLSFGMYLEVLHTYKDLIYNILIEKYQEVSGSLTMSDIYFIYSL